MNRSGFARFATACILATATIHAQQPPIIDRAAFFGEIQIAGAQISPDGQYLSFLSLTRARAISGSRRLASLSPQPGR